MNDRLRSRLLWSLIAAMVVVLSAATVFALLHARDQDADIAATTTSSVVAVDGGDQGQGASEQIGSVVSGTTETGVSTTTRHGATTTTTPKAGGGTSPPTTTTSTASPPTTPQSVPTTTATVNRPAVTGVRGRVVDMTSGAPIEGATVTAEGSSVVTGPDGAFALGVGVFVGDSLLAEKAGYISARRVVRSIGADGWAEVELGLLSASSPDAPPPPPSQ